MSFILIDDFNENIHIVCKEDGSGDPLIITDLKDAETLLTEYCQNGIIVSLNDTIGLIKRVKDMIDSGKIYFEGKTIEDRKNYLSIQNRLNEILA